MVKINNKGRLNNLVLALDVIGFVTIVVGAGIIRYSKDEIVSILGGFVLAAGVTVISITRLVK